MILNAAGKFARALCPFAGGYFKKQTSAKGSCNKGYYIETLTQSLAQQAKTIVTSKMKLFVKTVNEFQHKTAATELHLLVQEF